MELELTREYYPEGTNGTLAAPALPFVQRLSCHGKIIVPVFRVFLKAGIL